MKTYHVRIHQGDLEIEVTSEDKGFVESQIAKFFSPKPQDAKEKHGHRVTGSFSARATAGKPISLPEFRRTVAPQSASEYVACVAYHLEKNQNISEFGTKELLAGLKDLKLNVKNYSDAILKAKGAGYLMPGKTKGHLMLSNSGEKCVDDLMSRTKG